MLPIENSKIDYYEGAANNLPDNNAYKTALKIKSLCSNLKESDLLIVLISGGGSALLPCPSKPLSLDDKCTIVKLLSNRGANINELNTVRQQLSELKGGKLAEMARPAQVICLMSFGKNVTFTVISLIVSDIIGNNLQFVASGPTVPSLTTPQQALEVIGKYCAQNEIPESVKMILSSKSGETRGNYGENFDHVTNVVLADNGIALKAAKQYSDSKGVPAYIVTDDITGESSIAGRLFAQLSNKIVSNELDINWRNLSANFNALLPKSVDKSAHVDRFLKFVNEQRNSDKNFCLLWGGETTVSVKGRGVGGRNQEMVLAFFHELLTTNSHESSSWNFTFCSAGTDGQDGPTNAAGAFVSKSMLTKHMCQTDVSKYLNNNDSYSFFEKFLDGKCHLKPGLTGTNVMDMQILYFEKLGARSDS